jgi:hypothetical protein
MKIGVVIGHFNCLNFLELSLELIRKHSPYVEVLVSDDISVSESYTVFGDNIQERLKELCSRYENVELSVNENRLGHFQGDFYHMRKGVEWANKNGLNYICKLSQRCVLDGKHFLLSKCNEMEEGELDVLFYKKTTHSFFLLFKVETIIKYIDDLDYSKLKGNMVEQKIDNFCVNNKFNIGFIDDDCVYHRLISKEEDYNRLCSENNIDRTILSDFSISRNCETSHRNEHIITEKNNKVKLEAITISINYSDYLDVVLQSNKGMFDKWIIVTHSKDINTIDVCKKHSAEYIFCDEILDSSDDKYFRKGLGYNKAIELLDKDGWIVHIDSDVVLPRNFNERLDVEMKKFNYEKDAIYFMGRTYAFDETGLEEYFDKSDNFSYFSHRGKFHCMGYLNVFHNSFTPALTYPTKSNHAGRDDGRFNGMFEKKYGMKFTCCHLGFTANWHGRQHSSYGHTWNQPKKECVTTKERNTRLVVRNMNTGTAPQIVHFNGGTFKNINKDIYDICKSWCFGESIKALYNTYTFREDLTIFTAANKSDYMLLKFAEHVGIPVIQLGADISRSEWKNKLKIKLYRDALRECKTRYVICADASDVLFIDHPNEIIDEFIKTGEKFMFNAEKACFKCGPTSYDFFNKRIELEDPTVFKYFNAGLCLGETESLLKFYETAQENITTYKPEDYYREQPLLVELISNKIIKEVYVDTSCKIMQSVYQIKGELQLEKNRSILNLAGPPTVNSVGNTATAQSDKPVEEQFIIVNFSDHDDYLKKQLSSSNKKSSEIWVTENQLNYLCEDISNKFSEQHIEGLCHGVKNGYELDYIKEKVVDCNVTGTDIIETNRTDIIQMDFHEEKKEWIGKFDFVYSNCLNHSDNHQECFELWMNYIKEGGYCYLHWSSPRHSLRQTTHEYPFGASALYYEKFITKNYKIESQIKKEGMIIYVIKK